jgi:hypothetical protein
MRVGGQQPSKNRSDELFQDWWNKHHYFTAQPLYQPYKQLYKLGANLDYVEQLLWRCLRANAKSQLSIKRKPAAIAAQENGHKPSLLPVLIGPDADQRPRTVEQILLEEAVWAGIKVGTRIDRFPEESDRKRICQEIAEGLIDASVRFRKQVKRGKADAIRNIKQLVELMRAHVNDECRTVVFEFSLMANLTGGRSTDLWGTLFMVALTEHLRSTSNKPHYFLAYKTLKAERGRASKGRESDRSSAEKMVMQFKQRFSYWPLLLKDLKA